jgi:hypothetical protein
MNCTRTPKPNAMWSMKTPAFVCPVRRGNSFETQGFFAIAPSVTRRPGKVEGGPLRR